MNETKKKKKKKLIICFYAIAMLRINNKVTQPREKFLEVCGLLAIFTIIYFYFYLFKYCIITSFLIAYRAI